VRNTGLTLSAVQILTLALAGVATAGGMEVNFGPTAITAQETARLNAFCDGSVSPNPCQVKFEFHDADGSVLLSRTMTLDPNTGGFVDLPAEKAGLARGRGEIDPCLDIAVGGAFVSLEIFDTGSQRTRLLINWGDRSMPRTGDVDFGPAGITPSDTARLGATCPASDERGGGLACNVLFEYHDMNGRTLKQLAVTIEPGKSAFLDLHFAEAGSIARRVTIDPCWKVGDGGPVTGTFVIIDDGIGQPGVQSYPAALASAQ